MTTFVLHGGASSTESEDNKKFFSYFTSLINKDEVNVLLCYWARPKEEWSNLLERDTKKIDEQTSKDFQVLIANDIQDFRSKIPLVDVIYVAGGYAELIEPLYKDLGDLRTLIINKVFIGSSMGAFLISDKYILSPDSEDTDTIHQGLGILPVNTLCHWNIEDKKEKKLDLLKLAKPQMPTLVLNEGQSVVYYI